jgi:hypothetical protein
MAGKKTNKRKPKTGLKRKSKDPIKLIGEEERKLKRKLHRLVNGISTEVIKKDEETAYSYRFVYPGKFVEFCLGIARQTIETIKQNQALAQAEKLKNVVEEEVDNP